MKSTQRLQSRRRILLLGAILAILTAWAQPGFTQDVRITGRLVSAVDGGPLVGVSVLEQGTNNGVTTNTDGQFVLQAPLGSQLVFSFVGYVSKTLKAATANMGTVKLDEDAQNLNSVVVVGYGTQKKMNLTGAISILDLSEKEGQPITNVSNALHGMPGLFVNLGNSQPGVDRSSIHIRGFGTLNNSSPLVLVNGVEYNMDELNPNDIETVTVLKDAAAAIYGSRAANGVIIITTKSGKGTSKVNYSYYYGEQKPTYLPDAIWDPITYMKLKNQAELNEGKTTVDYSDADIAEYEQGMKTDPITYPSSNWFDIALGNGVMQKHDISFSGSSDKYAFRLALGYLNRDGVLFGPGNHENKYSIGLNASVNLTKRLTVGTTINGYYRNYTEPLYNSIWSYMMRTLPIMTDTLADGRYGNSWLRTPGRNNWEHPRMIAFNGYSHKYVQRFLSTVYADYKLPFDITYN
ncbi:MAG TPA: SusC/RagA family TonB-linked outer membrane protein, partial [Chitinophagaceae bacterium]|nr:SusC/RagA family TonB-linked outer membrane protein [Chitinophagaceae bacterium]